MFICDHCERVCKSKAGLTNHKKIHKEDVIEIKSIQSVTEYIAYE